MSHTLPKNHCIHDVCQQRYRPCQVRNSRLRPLPFSGNGRIVSASAGRLDYGSNYDAYSSYDEGYGGESIMPAVDDPMKILLEEFELEVDTLFQPKAQPNSSYQSWESTPLGQDEMADPAALEEEYEEESVLIESEDEEYDADEIHEHQMAFELEGRQMHQMEQVYDKAFELHHGQMARSVNPYATTLFYANVLEDMSKIDEAGETSEIPAWIRALYVMERNFDGWNEALREKLLASQVTLAKNFDAQKLAEYRESVSELNGDFDYSQLTFATASASAEEEEAAAAAEDVSGVGDRLEPLLDVLPGVAGGEAAQAAQFAQELMLPAALANSGDAALPGDASGTEPESEEDDDEEVDELDF
eukprot:jgi/Ulvmu1/11755/UM008_0169.1